MKKFAPIMRILAFTLIMCLCSSLAPMATFAEEAGAQTPVTERESVVNPLNGIATEPATVYSAVHNSVWSNTAFKSVTNEGVDFVDFNNKYGSLDFTVNVETAGEYYLGVGYGCRNNRYFGLTVNGKDFGSYACPANGDSYYSVPISYNFEKVSLNAGNNSVSVYRPTDLAAASIAEIILFPVSEWLSYSDTPTLGGGATATSLSSAYGINDYGYHPGSSTGTVTWDVTIPVNGTYTVTVPFYATTADTNAISILVNNTHMASVGESTTKTGKGWKLLTTEEIYLEAGESVSVTLSWAGSKYLGGIRLELVQGEAVDPEVVDDVMDGLPATNYTSIKDVQSLLNRILWEYTLEATLQTKATATTEGLYKIKVTLPDSTEYTRDIVIPKVPALDYAFGLSVPGMAQGTVIVTLPDGDTNSEYGLYWGTEDGVLDGYTYLTQRDDFKAAKNVLTYQVPERVVIPTEATHLWLTLDGVRVTSYEIPAARRTTLGNLQYSFGATADTHLFTKGENNEKYVLAMDMFSSANADFVLIAGDIIGSATQSYWDTFNNINANYNQPVFVVPGNHDVLCHWNGTTNPEAVTKMVNSVPTYGNENFTTDANGNQYKVTKGDTVVDYTVEYGDDLFVYLGVGIVDMDFENKSKVTDQHLAPEQIEWLKKVFATADDYENVFLVFHYAAFESGFATYNGSDWTMDWSWEHNGYMTEGYSSAEEFYKILKDHPNVITFSGHTHRSFNGDQNLTVTKNYNFNYENYTWTTGTDPLGFTAVHVPTTQNYQAYVTYVYNSGVLLSGYDTSTGEVVSHANFYLPKTIDDETQPLKIQAPSTVCEGQTVTLSVPGYNGIVWTLLDGADIASVDGNGKLTVTGAGTIVVKATYGVMRSGLPMESTATIESRRLLDGSAAGATIAGSVISRLTKGERTYFDYGGGKFNGQSATYTVYTDRAGEYYMGISYCVGSNTTRKLAISVNEGSGQEVTFLRNSPAWGGNDSARWSYRIIPVTLQKGENTVTLAQTGSNDAPQISDLLFALDEEWYTAKENPTVDGETKISSDYGIDGYAYNGGTVQWKVNVSTSGKYRIHVAYSSTGNATVDLLVNNAIGETLSGTATANTIGNAYNLLTVDEIPLSAGENTVSLECTGGYLGGFRLELIEADLPTSSKDLTVSYKGVSAAGTVYSLDMVWENNDFTFNYTAGEQGVWNPNDHTFGQTANAGWTDKDLTVTVFNHSNVAVKVTMAITDADADDGLSVTADKNTETLATAEGTTRDNAPKVEFVLTIEGAPTASVTKVATATVSFAKPE